MKFWHCDSCHSVTFYNENGMLFGLRNWCFHNSTWLFCDPCNMCRSIVTFATTDKWTKIMFGNVTLWQLSQCPIFRNMESCFGFNIDALKMFFCDSCHTFRSFVTFVTTDKWPQKIFVNVTVWQRSQCHIFKYYFCLFSGVTNALTLWKVIVWHLSQK